MGEGSKAPESRRSRRKDALQRQIIDVALKVFAEQGFERATMEAIAAEADIAKATLYRYFPVKEAILAGYWRYLAQEKEAQFDQLLKRHKSTRKRLTAFLESSMDEAVKHGVLFDAYLRFRMQHLHDEELQEQLRSGTHLRIGRMLEEGVQAGEIRADIPVRLLAGQFSLTAFMLYSTRHRYPNRAAIKKAVAVIVELYLRGAGYAE